MRPPHTASQSSFPRFQPTTPLNSESAGKQRGRFLLPFALGVGLAGVGGLLIYMQSQRKTSVRPPAGGVKKVVTVKEMPPMPPMPPEAIEAIKHATGGAHWEHLASLAPLDESDAVVNGDETVITKTYPLDREASFAIRNLNGNVTVEGWDKETAEVRVHKRGGSGEERREARVMYSMKDERLTLMTTAKRGGDVEVTYEIRLPRGLHQLEINSEESEVKVAGMSGTVVVDVKQGALEFMDVTGTARGKLIKGNAKVSYRSAPPRGAQEFSVVRGNIEVDLADGMNTDVKAETMDGDVEADSALGLKVVKTAAGKHLLGRLGTGADPLLIKVVNGDIKLKK